MKKVPPLSPEAELATDEWRSRETIRGADGATLRVSEKFRYDLRRQLRVATLRYEVIQKGETIQSEEEVGCENISHCMCSSGS